MTTDQTIEAEIQAKGLTAPRVKPADIEDAIREEHYFTGEAALDAVRFRWLIEDHRNPNERQAARDVAERIGVLGEGGARLAVDVAMGRDGNGWNQQALGLLTFCVLVLKNGHTVTGEAYCADPAKFSAETGRIEARKVAISKLWPMVVYAERERLAVAFKHHTVVEISRQFIEDNLVSCPEATSNDRVYENAPELVEKLADAVGYYQYPDEGEA